MDYSKDRRVALLSIHPIHANAILAGHKTVEFRRRTFARPVDQIAIYSTAPVQRVIGIFDVDKVDFAPPHQLWARYGNVGAIDRGEFEAYYGNVDQGAAIQIGRVMPLISPVSLATLGDIYPPQNFAYLDEDVRRLLASFTPATPERSRRARVWSLTSLSVSKFSGLVTSITSGLLPRMHRAVRMGAEHADRNRTAPSPVERPY